jgi:glycosyltransferase involved in cell wall biosynthesis
MENAMTNQTKPRLLMFAFSSVINESRVRKTATSMAKSFQVRVVGIDPNSESIGPIEPGEKPLPFQIHRIEYPLLGRMKRGRFTYAMMYLKMVLRMVLYALWYRPAVIWASGWSVLHPAIWAIRLTRAKLVYDSRELYREKRRAPGYATALKYENWALKHADLVIACNRFRAQIMLDEYGARRLPAVIPNYVPFREYTPDSTLRDYVRSRNPSIETVVLYQGVINAGRGLETCIQSLRYLPPSVGLILVGSGERGYVDDIQRQTAEWGFGDRCFFYGPVPYRELNRITPSVDLGIVSYLNINRNNYYCAPNKLYEYAMGGVPMLGADLPPIRDFLETTETGAVFDATSSEDLAKNIMQFVDNPDLLRRYHENALRAAPNYTWDRNTQELNDLVMQLLETEEAVQTACRESD